LFEWLSARREVDESANADSFSPFEPEDLVLSRIEGQLENQLTEIFDADYSEKLAKAKLSVSD
jgi:hypothetical protein